MNSCSNTNIITPETGRYGMPYTSPVELSYTSVKTIAFLKHNSELSITT